MPRVHGEASIAEPALTPFDYIFPELQDDPLNLLEESDETLVKLKVLGATMQDPGNRIPDSDIPSAYTYFGQFVAHDISFEKASSRIINIADPHTKPMPQDQIKQQLADTRSPNLELDSVYGMGSVRDHDWMRVGRVSFAPLGRPPGKGDYNDLPRSERSLKKKRDRVAQIGDPRNDENLILSQMHVAFLHAHNRLINEGKNFDEARKRIRQHYQLVVLKDFLMRIADPQIVNGAKTGNSFFTPSDNRFFIPLEFSAAAFRFGHSMVRDGYNDYNNTKQNAGLEMLFTFTRFSGGLGMGGNDRDTLPADWIIQWEGFIDSGQSFNHARRIDTTLVEPLLKLQPAAGAQSPSVASLAVRNLLRGYVLRLPTGQAVARRMGLTPLTDAQLGWAADQVSPRQRTALEETGFISRTPLWYYILAEAACTRESTGKDHLGPVGSTLVAEVLLEILRRSDDSILGPPYTAENPWVPTLPGVTAGKFDLSDFLRFAGVLI